MSQDRFLQEVKANLAARHDRIVRLLTAFSYREQFYLIFPLAGEGSLEKLWKSYVPGGINQQSTPARAAYWYSDEWLLGECLGLAEALLATHELNAGSLGGTEGLLHADIKPENILCFPGSDLSNPSITLKLADFGEAKRVSSNVELTASKVAHVKTYRPPEHLTGNVITLNYDIWCLGCLFLEFVTWAVLGQNGLDAFVEKRQEEKDDSAVSKNPAQIIEDTFFKRVKGDPSPFILKRLHWGGKRTMEVEQGRATTTYSLWAASHVNITSRVKDSVVSVSICCHMRSSSKLT